MNLDRYFEYLADAFVASKAAAMNELSAACREYGIPEVRRYIRSKRGKAPFITRVLEQTEEGLDLYWMTSYCSEYILEETEEKVYVTEHYYSDPMVAYRRGRKHYLKFRPERFDYVLAKTPDEFIIYHGISLDRWISSGHECEECGTLFISESYDACLCPSCEEQYQPRQYSHPVEDELGFEDTKEIRFGVELEYEKVTARDVFNTLKDHALPKRDGSINDGVEIVTRPACMTTHKKHLQNFYDKIKVQAEPNTGMHVHIERNKLSEYQIGFIMAFLNNRNLAPHIKQVAGRDYESNNYTRLNSAHTMTYGLYYNNSERKVQRSDTDKYSPLNTAKRHTVEIRIFSSPNTAEECFAKLDFVAALVKYSSPYSVSVKSLKDKFNWDIFTQFIMNNRKEFPNYFNYFLKGTV